MVYRFSLFEILLELGKSHRLFKNVPKITPENCEDNVEKFFI